jgi:hypothetical protein
MKVMDDNALPCLDMLEATPTVLRGLMAELTEEDARWKPAPDRFSVGEVLAHLGFLDLQPGPSASRRTWWRLPDDQ